MAQVARNLVDAADGFPTAHRVLICDRDTEFAEQFKRIVGDEGIDVVLTPKQAPNCNAHAKRFVPSIRSECLRRMMFFGEAWLQKAITEYVAHYHEERAHQGLGNEWIQRGAAVGDGEVVYDERLGGLLECYRRAA